MVQCEPVATSAFTEAVFSLPEIDRRGGVSLARDFARYAALNCGYRGSHDDVVLVADEFTTHAVRHGSGRPIVRITGNRDRVRVEVADHAATEPRAGSWGLRLVAELCEAWGVAAETGRRVVWCELAAGWG